MTPRSHIPLLLLPLLLIGCKSAPAPAPTPAAETTPAVTYPARPTTPPPAFKIFHHANSSFTLTVKDTATDDEISALVWQLRDAARTHSFDNIKIPQKEVDADGTTVWFHIYRGTKCAPEKYAPGPLPAEPATTPPATTPSPPTPPPVGQRLNSTPANDHPTDLWNPDAPYTPSN